MKNIYVYNTYNVIPMIEYAYIYICARTQYLNQILLGGGHKQLFGTNCVRCPVREAFFDNPWKHGTIVLKSHRDN